MPHEIINLNQETSFPIDKVILHNSILPKCQKTIKSQPDEAIKIEKKEHQNKSYFTFHSKNKER